MDMLPMRTWASERVECGRRSRKLAHIFGKTAGASPGVYVETQ